jgi:single-strand DNA-binding protein
VEGRLQTRQWEDQSGQKRYTTELIANTVTPLDPRPRDADGEPAGVPGGEPVRSGSRPAGRSGGQGPSGGEPPDRLDDTDLDDLPF